MHSLAPLPRAHSPVQLAGFGLSIHFNPTPADPASLSVCSQGARLAWVNVKQMGDGTCYVEACVYVSLGFYKVLYKGGAAGFAAGGSEATDRVVSLLNLMGLEVSRGPVTRCCTRSGGVEWLRCP